MRGLGLGEEIFEIGKLRDLEKIVGKKERADSLETLIPRSGVHETRTRLQET
jgi:hypothetical protein